MISSRTSRLLPTVIVALLGSTAWTSGSNQPPIHLEFEISRTPLGPYSATQQRYGHPQRREDADLWREFATLKPAYAVDITIVGPTDYLPFPNRIRWSSFQQDYAMRYADLSEGQKALLAITQALLPKGYPGPLRSHIDPNHPVHLRLYAMTVDDARKMAVAYYQYAMREFQREVMEAENQLATQRENMETAQKRLAELEKTSATARQALEELQKKVPYRDDSEAQAAIGELDRILTTARVEVAGITAKLEAIQAYRERPLAKGETRVTSPETTAKLDAMLVEESIALRGAQAREQMATRLREQANRFLELKAIVTNAPLEKKLLTEALETARRSLSSWQEALEERTQQKPQIPAKVVIHPVQWAVPTPAPQ